MIYNYPKPANWQDFQRFMKDLLNEKYGGGFDVYGRIGQRQDGIDVLGRSNKDVIGVQCRKVQKLTIEIVKTEVAKTDKSTLRLNKFIFATTFPLDAPIQKKMLKLNEMRRKKAQFEIEIWFWDTIEDEINGDIKIKEKYYGDILQKINPKYKNNHILRAIYSSFNRPAFMTPFQLENNGNDFLQAIIDTQEFLNTGKLKNRDKNYIAGSLPYKNLSNKKDVRNIDSVSNILQQIRDSFTKYIKNKSIKTCVGTTNCFCILDKSAGIELDTLRRKVLNNLNKVFDRHKMQKLQIRF